MCAVQVVPEVKVMCAVQVVPAVPMMRAVKICPQQLFSSVLSAVLLTIANSTDGIRNVCLCVLV